MNFIFDWQKIFYQRAQRVSIILFLPRENKIHIFKPPCNILYIFHTGKQLCCRRCMERLLMQSRHLLNFKEIVQNISPFLIGLNPLLITSELCLILEDTRCNDVNLIVTERKNEYSRGSPCDHSRKRPAPGTTTFQLRWSLTIASTVIQHSVSD